MRLRTLRLHGFKSFADRTQLEFRDGITAIVGSNGCGKSNIADAIRWVLGEQRASAVRGAKMDEVIFQGTTRRRPLNFAEVALLFSNEHGRVAVPQSEIEIARRTFREGGSEYSLNRTACRLRDIHNLLRDTGLGSNAYSIIEAAMIETLLSDRAEERRGLFEEAAGIGRYKDNRQATTRRLEGAEADLARLGDLVAEVESKVRSLARQRRRAQRLQELRARRLDLELAGARLELARLGQVLDDGRRRIAELERDGDAARQARVEAEARLGRCRAEQADATARRATLAAGLDAVRGRLHAREREALLADERRANAELRIEQLARERADQERRRGSLDAEAEQLRDRLADARQRLDAARGAVEASSEEGDEVRGLLSAARQRAGAAADRLQRLARDLAAAEGERDAHRARLDESARQLERLHDQVRSLAGELEQAEAQTDLWVRQEANRLARLEAAEATAGTLDEEASVLRSREAAVRDVLRSADDRASRLAARVEAREALERSYDGFAPAVAAVMAEPGRFPGVHGPLADFLEVADAGAGRAAAAEDFLGPLLHALVVDDLAAARRLRDWFRDEWKGGGALLLLPCDAPSLRSTASRRAAPGLGGHGAGRDWVDALLADVEILNGGDPLSDYGAAGARTADRGDLIDHRGVIRLSERGEGEGILTRRERLAALRAERDAARAERDRARAERDSLRESIEEAEERAREAGEVRRAMATELLQLRGEVLARTRHHERLRDEHRQANDLLAERREGAEAVAARARRLEGRLDELRASIGEAEVKARVERQRLATLEERWEAMRDADAERRVGVARAEAELREVERRLAAARHGAETARKRIEQIDAEATGLRRTLAEVSGVRERAGEELERLVAERDRETTALGRLDARLGELDAEARAAEERARRSRRQEDAAAEERHRLDLQLAEAGSRSERIRERLEAEWGRPWDALIASATPLDGADVAAWEAELREVVAQIESIGPVNMLAVEEHEEESKRLEFLLSQQNDLLAARDDLLAAIRQINRTAREVFLTTFSAIRENFQRTFHSLFQGGECDVWLADPDDPLESPIEIQASPRGKRTQRIHLLSGGERTLTALALLFAIYLVKPSPFCLLDEVDAPLDESNVGRFIQLLQEFKAETQFVVITHNTRTMEAADWVYGVTMEEPGVSSIVGVELEGAWAREGRVA